MDIVRREGADLFFVVSQWMAMRIRVFFRFPFLIQRKEEKEVSSLSTGEGRKGKKRVGRGDWLLALPTTSFPSMMGWKVAAWIGNSSLNPFFCKTSRVLGCKFKEVMGVFCEGMGAAGMVGWSERSIRSSRDRRAAKEEDVAGRNAWVHRVSDFGRK